MNSPASNALAHFLNLTLFLLGENESSAELARNVFAGPRGDTVKV